MIQAKVEEIINLIQDLIEVTAITTDIPKRESSVMSSLTNPEQAIAISQDFLPKILTGEAPEITKLVEGHMIIKAINHKILPEEAQMADLLVDMVANSNIRSLMIDHLIATMNLIISLPIIRNLLLAWTIK